MKKALSVLAITCAMIGVPLGMLIFLAGGMNTVPRLEFEQLMIGLPLVALSVLFGGIVILQCRGLKSPVPRLVLASVITSLLTVLVLIITYVDYR